MLISGCRSAVRTSSSVMMEMITELSPRSATTRSIDRIARDLAEHAADLGERLALVLARSSLRTDDSMTPSPPPDPYH